MLRAHVQGLRKLRTAGLVVRRGLGGRVDPYRYMIKAAFNRLSPEAQRAPLLPEDDDAPGSGCKAEAEEQSGGIAADEATKAEAGVEPLDMAPCGVEALPEESADSSFDVLASPPAPVLAAWRTVVSV